MDPNPTTIRRTHLKNEAAIGIPPIKVLGVINHPSSAPQDLSALYRYARKTLFIWPLEERTWAKDWLRIPLRPRRSLLRRTSHLPLR